VGAGLVQHIFPGKIFLDAGILHRNMILMCLHDSGSSLLASLSAITDDEVLHWSRNTCGTFPPTANAPALLQDPPMQKSHTQTISVHLPGSVFCYISMFSCFVNGLDQCLPRHGS